MSDARDGSHPQVKKGGVNTAPANRRPNPPPAQSPPAQSLNAQGRYEHAEAVDHPARYRTEAGIEAVDVIEAFGLDWHRCLGGL